VKVTHGCDKAKKQHLIDNDISALEIDLSEHHANEDEAQVRRAFLRTAPRIWLHNDAVNRSRQKRQARFQSRAAALLAVARTAPVSDPSAEMVQAEANLESLGLGGWIGRALGPTPGFVVPDRTWQALLLQRLVLEPLGDDRPLVAFRPVEAAALISDCLAPGFAQRMGPELVEAFKTQEPGFVTPVQVVARYFRKLAADGCLRDETSFHWSVPRDTERRLGAIIRRYKQSVERIDATTRRVKTLLTASRVDHAFDLEAWLDLPVREARSPHAHARGDAETWSRFDAALRALERMIDEPRPAADLLGLPLEALLANATARAEAAQAERDRVQAECEAKAAADRAATLEACARALIGAHAAQDWLDGPFTDGRTPRIRAMVGEADLGHMKALLRTHAEALERRARAAADKDRNLLEVFSRALAFFGDELRARLFMTGLNPGLGRRTPEEACEDARGFQACLNLLTRKPPRRR
jgi:hypothetical protein